MSIEVTTDLNIVSTSQIADNAVTEQKINSEAAPANTVLTADGAGNASFEPVPGFNPMFLTGV